MRQKICKWNIYAALCLGCAAISACRTALPPAPVQAPAPAPELAASQQVHRILANESLLAITVRRGGPLARLGHDHVVATRALEGFVDVARGRTELRFRLDQLTVDDPALRLEAGLSTQPSADAIDGTRRNMFSKVLQAELHPWVLVRATLDGQVLHADITLHGVTRRYQVPVQLTVQGNSVQARGAFLARQTDFGITPFAVFGGALSVKDEMELRFSISARR
jgi:hypothetical protein